MPEKSHKFHHFSDKTCPWWFIGTFDNPLRSLIHRPEQILAGLVSEGQDVLDVGPGMGYFTIPMARLVGESGSVVAADLQPEMLAGLRRRAEAAGVLSRIHPHLAQPEKIGLAASFDFVLAFWMVHEVRRPDAFFREIFTLLKPGSQCLLVEPLIHVSEKQFLKEVQTAVEQGFRFSKGPTIRLSRSMLLTRDP